MPYEKHINRRERYCTYDRKEMKNYFTMYELMLLIHKILLVNKKNIYIYTH